MEGIQHGGELFKYVHLLVGKLGVEGDQPVWNQTSGKFTGVLLFFQQERWNLLGQTFICKMRRVGAQDCQEVPPPYLKALSLNPDTSGLMRTQG